MSADAAAPLRSRGRPRNPSDETPQARVARLQAELEAAQAALAAEADKQALVVGRAVLARLPDDPALRASVVPMLRAAVTRKEDRATIAPLLVER